MNIELEVGDLIVYKDESIKLITGIKKDVYKSDDLGGDIIEYVTLKPSSHKIYKNLIFSNLIYSELAWGSTIIKL